MKWLLVLLLGIALGAVGYRWLAAAPPLVTVAPTPSVVISPNPTSAASNPEAEPVIAVAEAPVVPAPVLPAPVMEVAAPHAGTTPPAPATPGALLLPVQGVTADQLQDTFTQARSEGRSHDAIDIMAAAGTPVLAVVDGTVEKLFTSIRGGLTIYQFVPGGPKAYYYAHLQRYADGLAQGQVIRRGQVIGYVGSTGNASPDAPHLHFAIFVLGPERRWWEGKAINPYPVLTGTRQAR
ncbi:MAG: peptidoglycan DD-metalloendopeptidase family protein [Pseudoxanthomonas sp.]